MIYLFCGSLAGWLAGCRDHKHVKYAVEGREKVCDILTFIVARSDKNNNNNQTTTTTEYDTDDRVL